MNTLTPEFLKRVNNKNVFYRIDANIDMYGATILNDFRLRAVVPTLRALTDAGAHITIATHIGRPQGTQKELSTTPLKRWFADHGFPNSNFLENLRFDEGETTHDPEKALTYAQRLAEGMDFYVNDAWGLLHRTNTSITVLPQLFPSANRAFGLLVEKELAALTILKNTPQKPYVIIVGGGKVETKLPIIQRLLEKSAQSNFKIRTIIILPALSFTFMRALGMQTGASLIDENLIPQAASIMERAHTYGVELLFPLDYTYLLDKNSGVNMCNADALPSNAFGVGVGSTSRELFKPHIMNAQTIFLNGAMGITNRPETMKPFDDILTMVANSNAYSVIGGGSSVAEVEKLGLVSDITYCSTGGGSTLTYISDGPMPGLDAMHDNFEHGL